MSIMLKWNKKVRAGVLSLIALPAFVSSCTDDDALSRPTTRDVYLQAAVGSTSSARSPYELVEPTVEEPLDALVLASGTSEEYEMPVADGWNPETKKGKTDARFFCGYPQLISYVKYPDGGGTLYFVAMYPQTGWKDGSDNNLVTYTFTGKEDVLFAPQESGTATATTTTVPALTFKHLLTWLCVSIKAENEGAASAWGRLKSLKIKSDNTVTVALKGVNADGTISPIFTSTNGSYLSLYDNVTDDVFPSGEPELPYGSSEPLKAYVLCAPPQVDNSASESEITFDLETENRTAEIPVILKTAENTPFTGSTMGYKFQVNLILKLGLNIAPSASLVPWTYGGSGSANVTP